MFDYSNPLESKKYFNQFNGDFDNRVEIESYNQEMYQYSTIYGVPLEYYTINVDAYKSGMDVVYGENSKPKWDKKYKMVGLLEDFTQEVRSFGAVGLENIDEISFYIHRSMFDSIVGVRTLKNANKSSNRRGAYGPIANDQIMTPHNGIIYEVLEGGLHFLSSQAQQFGHKFWYKVSCKVRQVSDATMGEGEQYGAIPDLELDSKYKGNPQFLLPSPDKEEIYASNGTVNTNSISSSGATRQCNPIEYVTVGTPDGPLDGVPSDIIDQSGNVASKYIVPGTKENSLFRDNEEIIKEENTVINPETDHKVDPNPIDGTVGRVIQHKRKELFSDWD